MCAEDMYDVLTDKTNLTPPIDSRVTADWNVVGFITAVDAVLDTQQLGKGTRCYYGFVACSKTDPTEYVAVIRGTANMTEWIEDAEFLPVPAPARMRGRVENGFFSIYASMNYTPVGGTTLMPVIDGIAATVGRNRVTVLGHSLGSALATYLALDLALAMPQFGGILRAAMFASPHPGDDVFATFFDSKVADYQVFNYSRDLVPHVPEFFDYSALDQAFTFSPDEAQAIIQDTPGGNHHAICYAAMLDYQAADWKNVPAVDQACAACIEGPNPPNPATP
jgi:hypothetical protein